MAVCASSTAVIARCLAENCPHFAARFGDVFFRDVYIEVFPDSFEASQRLLCAFARFEGLDKLQDFLLLHPEAAPSVSQAPYFFDGHGSVKVISPL